jgi:hypothetical protein
MDPITNPSRRTLLKKLVVGLALIPIIDLGIGQAFAAGAPLVTADDPTAKGLKYVDNASQASGAKPGSNCANCKLYQGVAGSAQGPCPLFSGKQVKAAGWCASWTTKS